MLKSLITIMFCLLFLTPDAITPAFGSGFQTEDKVIPYKVVSNKILYSTRCLDILIDEKDFSIDNLKILMNHFFKDYPNTKRLWIFVATDKAHYLYDPVEYSDPSERPGALHPYGGLHRENDKEFIRYKFPNAKLETIIIKD